MDELTRERFLAAPTKPPRYVDPEDVLSERRIVLCGTDDLTVGAQRQQHFRLRAARLGRDRKLVRAIRRTYPQHHVNLGGLTEAVKSAADTLGLP